MEFCGLREPRACSQRLEGPSCPPFLCMWRVRGWPLRQALVVCLALSRRVGIASAGHCPFCPCLAPYSTAMPKAVMVPSGLARAGCRRGLAGSWGQGAGLEPRWLPPQAPAFAERLNKLRVDVPPVRAMVQHLGLAYGKSKWPDGEVPNYRMGKCVPTGRSPEV
jgi:hypothetical protein